MSNREHLFAIVGTAPEAEATLDLIHDAVRRGGRATLIVMLSETDRQHIRDYAESEDLSIREAEAIYIDATSSSIRARVGGEDTMAIVTHGQTDGGRAMEAAVKNHATLMAVPSKVAARRSWRHALSTTTIPVVITPTSAA